MDLRRFKCINASSQAFLPGFLPFDTLLQMQNAKGRLRLYPGSYDVEFYFFCPGLFQRFNQSLYVLSTAFIITSKKKTELTEKFLFACSREHAQKKYKTKCILLKSEVTNLPTTLTGHFRSNQYLTPLHHCTTANKMRLLIKRSYFLFHIC